MDILEELKAILKITWEEEDDTLLLPMIKRGQAKIKSIVSKKVNFDEDLVARDLLLNYCRYAYNNAGEYFEENFCSEIVSLQLEYAIKEGLE